MSVVEALQSALAAEHAALYVYGALGARTSESATPALFAAVTDAYVAHRTARDRLTSTLVDLAAEPVAADPTYELPSTGPTPAGVARAAAEIEDRCATTYAFVVANTTSTDRAWAIGALTGAATRRVGFGGVPPAFPGAPDLG